VSDRTPADGHRLLKLSGVSYAYPDSPSGVDNVSFELSRGALVAVIGANGSGKSTLLRLLAGILKPASGTIQWSGESGSRRRRVFARQVAYVGQSNDMAFPFLVLDVVLAGRTPHLHRFRFESDEDREIAVEALRTVGVDHLAHRPVTGLSVGERQLVAIARGLAQRTACLLLDEPTAALDPTHRWQVVRVVREMQSVRGLATVFVTHDLASLDDGFDRVVAMRSGRIVAAGRPSEVLDDDVLARVYDDSGVRTRRVEGRTFVWSGPN
jgi:iron complex transport system ATP-binding protein